MNAVIPFKPGSYTVENKNPVVETYGLVDN